MIVLTGVRGSAPGQGVSITDRADDSAVHTRGDVTENAASAEVGQFGARSAPRSSAAFAVEDPRLDVRTREPGFDEVDRLLRIGGAADEDVERDEPIFRPLVETDV